MKSAVYTLNSGNTSVEINRLNFQHKTLTSITDILAPNEILQHLASLARPPIIADVGTGTGIWLRELAKILPSDAQLDGFDFDTAKFPDPGQLPSNVKLAWGNSLKPFPKECLGHYDLVHVRCFLYALKAFQWEEMAANMRLLLRPGGYLFWEELGYQGIACLPLTVTHQRTMDLEMRYALSLGRDITAPSKLGSQMTAVGFTDCHQTTFSSFGKDENIQEMTAEALTIALTQSLHAIVTRGGFDWAQTNDDVDKWIEQQRHDITNNVCSLGLEIYWNIGRNSGERMALHG